MAIGRLWYLPSVDNPSNPFTRYTTSPTFEVRCRALPFSLIASFPPAIVGGCRIVRSAQVSVMKLQTGGYLTLDATLAKQRKASDQLENLYPPMKFYVLRETSGSDAYVLHGIEMLQERV
jgi:hypothetical protein